MENMNAIQKSRYIDKKFKNYISSTFSFEDSEMNKLFHSELDKVELYKGPYINLTLPFERGHNIEDLIKEGVLSRLFYNLSDIDYKRPLYCHQEEAIRLVKQGHSTVITTGTGSGKTESFLYPILNSILSDIENGNNEVGVRAIFLYPMNALVNDQIDRVRKILSGYNDITFGFFTGDTKNEVSKNFREDQRVNNNIDIPENELVSREEMRSKPPHLLFTNYSMLEYLLIRPNDYAIMNAESLKYWKFVVLDEAHTYSGAKGIEISYLLRRLVGVADKKPQFILTSATLGEQGKSEQEIVNFAERLTSTRFGVDDIIFSKRIDMNQKQKYRIEGNDYELLKAKIDDPAELRHVAKKYLKISSDKNSEILYDLLIADKNVYDISNILNKNCKLFTELYNETKEHFQNENQLIALIDLVNIAEKNGIGIFDLKYHSFVRALTGAYISLGMDRKISLVRTEKIDEMMTFEVGNCEFCNESYIIGRIMPSKENNGLEYLVHNNAIDIYENYDNNPVAQVDYFIFNNDLDDDIEEKVEAYELCTKCGEIHKKEYVDAKKCGCDDNNRIVVYKVSDSSTKEDNLLNNIKQCPICGNRKRNGVVRSLNIGKDQATALIGQILYETLGGAEVREDGLSNSVSLFDDIKDNKPSQDKVKQYIAFSDSRQQASYAAVFNKHNHERLLRKRLIWESIKENGYEDLEVERALAKLKNIIKSKDLFPELGAERGAWATLLVELLKVDGSYDGEGLGLYYFSLNIEKMMSEIKEEDIKKQEEFKGIDINKEKLATLIRVVTEVFKTTPAINHSESNLNEDERKEILGYKRFDNYIVLEKSNNSGKNNKSLKSFLPAPSRNNMSVKYIMKAFDCDSNKAKKILSMIFNLLLKANKRVYNDDLLFTKNSDGLDQFQIYANQYTIKNYKNKNTKFYRCTKCGKLTPYNINNKCIKNNCDGILHEVDPEVELSNNYYRNEYKNKKIERMIIEEHTGQIDRETAKSYQEDFKNKKINILSCSTTFEMGVDIGSLETVFMRNVPPTPANYVQRAGRAGRRKDSAAFILTFCSPSSHDFTFYEDPEKMIKGKISPPYFDILNTKILMRHLMAASLGYFFRQNKELFKNLDAFVFEGDGYNNFINYMKRRPDELNKYINEKVIPAELLDNLKDYRWVNIVEETDNRLDYMVKSYQEIKHECEEACEKASREMKKGNTKISVDYFHKQIERLRKIDVISALSNYGVIPSYGFPTDVVDLQVYEGGKIVGSNSLSRDLSIAITEYAPDSDVIVDKKKFTSRYISLRRSKDLAKNWYVNCPQCKRKNIFISTMDKKCEYCGAKLELTDDFYIDPIYGFKGVKAKESTTLKPKRSYAGKVEYIGHGSKVGTGISMGHGAIEIETSTNDELLIMNKSDFFMCTECGYTEIYKNNYPPKTLSGMEHCDYHLYNCKQSDLEHIHLGHKFKTDVTRIIIPSLSSTGDVNEDKALSFLYAFLDGISIGLDIERDDIAGLITYNNKSMSYDIILYDNVPGGAGHVKRLCDKETMILTLNETLKKVSYSCCDEETSCYNCLRNYRNQSYHSRLKRRYAIEVTKDLLRRINE